MHKVRITVPEIEGVVEISFYSKDDARIFFNFLTDNNIKAQLSIMIEEEETN